MRSFAIDESLFSVSMFNFSILVYVCEIVLSFAIHSISSSIVIFVKDSVSQNITEREKGKGDRVKDGNDIIRSVWEQKQK